MVEAGVEVGIGMLGEDEARQVRLSTQNAGNLVALNDIPGANGLTWGEAFAAISSAPAKAVGLGGEIGSLQPGRRADVVIWNDDPRSEEHTSELQSLMRISYAVFCLKKKRTMYNAPT